MSRRTERLASTIRQELAQVIMRELHDPRITGMPSITRVKVSADLSAADVYLTIMGEDGPRNATLNALRHSAGLMRSRLSERLTLRVAPYLRFHIDEDLKKEMALLDLLDRIRKEDAAATRADSSADPRDKPDAEADQQNNTENP